ncbi:MAG: endonuclease V [Thermodesulfovibrionales bacterium]
MEEFNETELWPREVSGAREIQEILSKRVCITPLKEKPSLIAGVDASYCDHTVIAIASLFTYPDLEHLADSFFQEKAIFPYIPGYLSFREGHALMEALKRLPRAPDLVLCDGQGIAHPRGIGVASHIGVLMGIPTIGCAKSRLVGEFDLPPSAKGRWTYLVYQGRNVGAVLRTRNGVKPVFVSPGHLMDIPSSVEIVMGSMGRFRLPEPLRRADSLSRGLRRGDSAEPPCTSSNGRRR